MSKALAEGDQFYLILLNFVNYFVRHKGYIKSEKEIDTIAEGGKILRRILSELREIVKPGVSTHDLNVYAEKEIRKKGGRPSFIGYGPKANAFPAGLCTSLNSVVVHGIPLKKDMLEQGDIVGLDIGMEYKDLYTDTAITIPAGNISPVAARLISIAEECL